MPVLAGFNSGYLKQNEDEIVKKITTSFPHKFFSQKELNISNDKLYNIAKKIIQLYTEKSKNYIEEENTDSIDINGELSDISITSFEAIESQYEDLITDLDGLNPLDYDIEQ